MYTEADQITAENIGKIFLCNDRQAGKGWSR